MQPPFLLGGGGLNLLPNFQKVGLDRTSNFRGRLVGKRWVTFFGGGGEGGGSKFYIKDKLKSEILNDKKQLINKNSFLCHN